MKWGLALGGGGVPGVAAHLGFVRSLFAEGLVPDVMVGTSAGGLVAGALAAGIPINALCMAWTDVVRDPYGLMTEEAINAIRLLRPEPIPGAFDLYSVVSDVLYHDAMRDFHSVKNWNPGYGVTTTDMVLLSPQLIHSENPIVTYTDNALVATAAFPPIFEGVLSNDKHLLVDGGVFDMVPVGRCKELGAEKVVAVKIGEASKLMPMEKISAEQLASLVVGSLLDRANASTNPSADLEITVHTAGGLLSLGSFETDYTEGSAIASINIQKIKRLVNG